MSRGEHRSLLAAFSAAARTGDLARLDQLLWRRRPRGVALKAASPGHGLPSSAPSLRLGVTPTLPPEDVEPDANTSDSPAQRRSSRTALRRWFDTLGRGAKWLLGIMLVALVGALVTALVASWMPSTELSAQLTAVSIDRNVTLAEFEARNGTDSAAIVRLVAQTTDPETETPTPSPSTTPEPTMTPEPTPSVEDDPVVEPTFSDRERERLDTGLRRALADPSVPDVELGSACSRDVSSSECGLHSLQRSLQVVDAEGQPSTVQPAKVANGLVKILRGTRMQPVGGHGKREPVGVTVNFNASLTGFDGKRVDVRWSLYNAARRGRVPHAWLRNQTALFLKGKAETHRRSDQFWAPIPKAKGLYFIRVSVYDADDGTRLDYADTSRFR